jgi:hypothetical protein
MEEAKRVARMAAIAHDKSESRQNCKEAQNPKERRRRSLFPSLSFSFLSRLPVCPYLIWASLSRWMDIGS